MGPPSVTAKSDSAKGSAGHGNELWASSREPGKERQFLE